MLDGDPPAGVQNRPRAYDRSARRRAHSCRSRWAEASSSASAGGADSISVTPPLPRVRLSSPTAISWLILVGKFLDMGSPRIDATLIAVTVVLGGRVVGKYTWFRSKCGASAGSAPVRLCIRACPDRLYRHPLCGSPLTAMAQEAVDYGWHETADRW
jgi:hypothetical protein